MNAKVAVPFSDGKIFEHFGNSAQFKLYDIVDGRVTGSEVVAADGTGHDEIGLWLIQHEVSAVICANIGPAAQGILRVAGIVTYIGIEGDADAAVASSLPENSIPRCRPTACMVTAVATRIAVAVAADMAVVMVAVIERLMKHLILILISFAALFVKADDSIIRAGWFRKVISPAEGVGIAGYDGGDRAAGKLDELEVHGLCLDDGRQKALILAFDILYFDADTIRRYRKFAAGKLGMSEAAVLVTCSHTHGGPHTRAYAKGHGEDDEYLLPDDPAHVDNRYVRELDTWVESAIAEFAARPNWTKCKVGFYSSACDENRNRRFTTADNCASFIAHRRMLHGISSGIADKELGTIVLLDPQSLAPLYVIGNYAAHPLASHAPGKGGLRITSDFPGFYRRYLENETGATAMFVQGAAGDLVPKDDELGIAAARQTGESLGKSSIAAIIDIQRNPQRFVMERPVIAASLRSFESPVRQVWRKILGKDRLELEVQCLSIGDVAFVGLPGEPVNELGLEVKWHSPYKRTFIAYGSIGNCGYVSPENLVAAGGYEPQYQQFASQDTLKLLTVARDVMFETRLVAFPDSGTPDNPYPDNQNLPLVNLPGGIKASKWQQ